MSENRFKRISSTLLIFAVVFTLSIIYFIFSGGIEVGTGTGVPVYHVVSFTESTIEYLLILTGFSLITAALFACRWYILNRLIPNLALKNLR
jgi:hypothetical protein